MTTFADLIAPLSEKDFLSQYFGAKPLHVPADGPNNKQLLDWAKVNALLAVRGYWTDTRLKMVLNTVPIPRDRYCDLTSMIGEWQWLANPGKVSAALAMGATLVANGADFVSPEIRAAGEAIERRLGGSTGANVYLSFKQIGGFGPHYDTTEVFAFHCEGEKVWRLYEGREDQPIGNPPGEAAVQMEYMRRAAGRPIAEVRMRPGDMLYIPRGWYHDAMAVSDSTLHVTYALGFHNGRSLLKVLEEAIPEIPSFRQYLPDAEIQGEAALKSHLQTLSRTLAAIVDSPDMLASVRAMQQASKWAGGAGYDVPKRAPFRAYKTTGKRIEVMWTANGAVAHVAGQQLQLGHAAATVAEWLSRRPMFSDLELQAQFPWLSAGLLEQVTGDLVRMGAYTA